MTKKRKSPTGPFPSQSPLLDYLMSQHRLFTDAELAGLLEMTAPTVSKLRNGRVNLSAGMVLRMVDKTGNSLSDVRARANVE